MTLSGAWRRLGVSGLAIVLLGLSIDDAAARKPKVPPGLDPGGAAVAIIGRGIDYTSPPRAKRLARDGEGALVSLDLVDGDAEPFAPASDGDDALADIILDESPGSRLVVARVPDNNQPILARALQFVAATPARVAVLVPALDTAIVPPALADAARRLGDLLIIVPARRLGKDGIAKAGDALVVAGRLDPSSGPPVQAELLVFVSGPDGAARVNAALAGRPVDDIAAARVAALAARLLAHAPRLTGAQLKTQILSFARRDTAIPVINDIGSVTGPK